MSKQTEQKPVAWVCDVPIAGGMYAERLTHNKPTHPNCINVKALYTHPQKELSDDDIIRIIEKEQSIYRKRFTTKYSDAIEFARAVLKAARGERIT